MLRSPARSRPILSVAARAWWALLVLVHLPALASAGRSVIAEPAGSNLLMGLALLLTVSVFILKLLNVRFLRFRRHEALVFVLACAVAHHEVAVDDGAGAIIYQTPIALATGVIIEGLFRARRVLRVARRRLACPLARCLLAARACRADATDALCCAQRVLLSRLAAPRAPPA